MKAKILKIIFTVYFFLAGCIVTYGMSKIGEYLVHGN